jgi:adenylate kinase
VPDELTIKVWKKALGALMAMSTDNPHEDWLVLDGMPRNVAQTQLVKDHLDIRKVIQLECVNIEGMIRRLNRHAIRENRADDANEEVIRWRFEVYQAQSAPVLACYPSKIVAQVEAAGSPAEVLSQILHQLVSIQNQLFREREK